MSLILDLDPKAQRTLEQAFGENLTRPALEALVAEGYRTNKFTRFQVQNLLGLSDRWEAEVWLKDHNLFRSQTIDDVLRDADTSRQARERACS